ncbi:MAG TPA: hypothetical protein EYP51_07230, partial [Thiotrichales bacterium]|nr:hypothetical protein [Thiotrichales bacterium]
MPEQEPQVTLDINGHAVTLLGTAHVSRQSAEMVEQLCNTGEYDDVAIELCESRHTALKDPDSLAKMDLLKVIRSGKATMVMASLALGAFQQRIAEQFGIEPGAEMKAAMQAAQEYDLKLHLIDREIGVTLKRVYRSVPWWLPVQPVHEISCASRFSKRIARAIIGEEISREALAIANTAAARIARV